MTRKLLITWLLFLIVHHSALAQVPVANFSSNVQSGCGPLTVTFKDESSGSPISWNWDFGGGILSNVPNPTITFPSGTYSVTLVVRNANGTNGVTKSNFIVVNPSPTARFSSDKQIGCVPSLIQFSDITDPAAGAITKWEWDFGDGATSTQKNPSHEYTTPGWFNVTLKVTSATGCTNILSLGRYVRIVAGLIPDFSMNAPTSCRAPFDVTFTNLTSGPGAITYQWNLGNGNTSTADNPATSYASTGSYNVTLRAVSDIGCVGTAQKTVDITGNGTTFTGPDTICINNTATFQNGSTTALTTVWDLGNGETANTTNAIGTYNTAGIFTVKMINVYTNCKDSLSKPLVVIDKPVVDFTAPKTEACQPPLDVHFQAAAPTAVSWSWQFGDGTTSTEQNPVHTYTTEGEFNVTLTITTRQGCTNTITKPAFVKVKKPTVAFVGLPQGGCIGNFTYTPLINIVSVEPIQSYLWEWGDGQTSTSSNPSHTYTATGRYTVKVTITTQGGCTATHTVADGVQVGNPPLAAFTANPLEACASQGILFTFQAAPAGPPAPVDVHEYLWDFGDDSTSVERDPLHKYQQAGDFTVELITYNNKCASLPATQVVRIKPPISKFDYQVDCSVSSQKVDFTDQSDVTGVGNITYTWDFGDGTPPQPGATNGTVSHTYATVGNYTAKLTVTSGDVNGCSHFSEQEIKLFNEKVDFTVTPGTKPICKGDLVTLSAVVDDPARILKYEWTIGTGAPFLDSREVNRRYFDDADYAVTLQITDINECKSQVTLDHAIVIGGPTASFTHSAGGCVNNAVTFINTSTSPQPITKYTFDFGDGTAPRDFTSAPFTHNYADTGSYIVKMTVFDGACEHSFTNTDVLTVTRPTAGFRGAFTTICPNTDLPFTDTSVGKGLSWRWDFGDGNSSTEQMPIHRYAANSGTYTVKQVVTDANGCKDSTTKNDYITLKKPVPAFTMRDTSSICRFLETKFTFQGSDHESLYWDFGDGTTSTLPNPNHFYNDYGKYEAKLYVIGYGGCVDSVSRFVNIYNPSFDSEIAMGPLPLKNCNSMMVDFTVTVPDNVRFIFYYDDGTVDSSQTKIFQHFYNQPRFYNPSMLIKDEVGCQQGRPGNGTIQIIGALPLFGVDKKNFCDEGTVNFTNYTIGNDPVTIENWDFGDGNTSTDLNPIHQFTKPGTFVVKHYVQTQTGCENTITDTVRVYATPDPRITGDTIACINEALALQATLVVPDTAITWKWDLGSNGQSVNENVSVKYAQTGTYTVGLEATNKLGCKDNTNRTLYVPPAPAITVAGGNQVTLPVGFGVTLPMTYSDGIAKYTWTPGRDLSCTDCATPVANPKFTTTYSVRVEDTFGCTATAGVTVNVVCNKENYFVPNTFSPNGDGQNDVFMPRGRSIDRVSRMQIFNRWGEMVFERRNFAVNDKSAGWDGTHKGKPAVADVYVYVIEFVCDNASVIPFRGNVTLLR